MTDRAGLPPLLSLVVLAWLALGGRAAADPLRVVVRVSDDNDAAAAERLRGQTSDLPLSLSEVRIARKTGVQATAAQVAELGQQTGADAVLWFAAVERRYLVLLSRPTAPPVLLARLPLTPGAEPDLRSSDLELLALVARAALQALGSDAPIPALSAAPDELPDDPAAMPAGAPEPAADPEPDPGAVQSATTADPTSAHLGLSLRHIVDGSGALGRVGAGLRAEVRHAAWGLGAEAALSYPVTVASPVGSVELSRSDLLARVDHHFAGHGATPLLGLHGGVALYGRHGSASSLTPTDDRTTPALLLGPHAGVSVLAGGVELQLSAALDVLPSPPRFVYRDVDAQGEPVRRTGYIPPTLSARLAVGALVRLL